MTGLASPIVPEAPAAIKALAMSPDSILVSWTPPANPNGVIKRYTVYFMEEGSREVSLGDMSD